MAVRPIVLYPDPVLLRPTDPVVHFDDALREMVGDLADTMYAAPGIGLAANQIGLPWRVCVIDLEGGETRGSLHVFVNPEIREVEGQQLGEEGCLSFPDITLEIERAFKCTVRAQDLEGRSSTATHEGLMARAILHECEHLDGRVFLQNVSPLKRELVKKQIRKRIKSGDWVHLAAH